MTPRPSEAQPSARQSGGIGLRDIDHLTGGRLGTHDVPCPECGPERRSLANRTRRVLRVWRVAEGFATMCCARCGVAGYATDGRGRNVDHQALAQARREAARMEAEASASRLAIARALWRRRGPIPGSPVETYLRDVRRYAGPLPATLAYLPPRDQHGPAMIAAFGLPDEPEPGVLAFQARALRGVHLTRLLADGSGKDGEQAKIMIGRSIGTPIVLAPPNDLLGLTIAEGIEDALSMHEATGLGAWAAGAASRMPALADAVPDWLDHVAVVQDLDADGRRHARSLADGLRDRHISAGVVSLEAAHG